MKVGQGFSKMLQNMEKKSVDKTYLSNQQQIVEISKREESVVLSQEEVFQTEEYVQSKKFMASHKKKSAQQPIGSTL